MASNFDTSKPIDHTLISDLPQQIRDLKNLLLSRIYWSASEPTVRKDGASFESNDKGSLWIDSDNNTIKILTNYSTPIWTNITEKTFEDFLASAREMLANFSVKHGSTPKVIIHNTTEEDADAGRKSEIVFKGEKADGTEHILAKIFAEHLGSSDDYECNFSIRINDSSDTPNDVDAPKGKCLLQVSNDYSGNPTLQLGQNAQTFSNSAPDGDKAIANKKYVDDTVNDAVTGINQIVQTVLKHYHTLYSVDYDSINGETQVNDGYYINGYPKVVTDGDTDMVSDTINNNKINDKFLVDVVLNASTDHEDHPVGFRLERKIGAEDWEYVADAEGDDNGGTANTCAFSVAYIQSRNRSASCSSFSFLDEPTTTDDIQYRILYYMANTNDTSEWYINRAYPGFDNTDKMETIPISTLTVKRFRELV